MEDYPARNMESEEENNQPTHAMPQVVGPNSAPTGSRINTFTGNYAAGAPDTTIITESVRRARAVVEQRGKVPTEAYRRELEERLNNDPQFLQELADPFNE